MRSWLGPLQWSAGTFGVIASLVVWQALLRAEDRAAQAHIEAHGVEEALSIRHRLTDGLVSVGAVAASLAGSGDVTHEKLRVAAGSVTRASPGLEALSWNPRVRAPERDRHEADCLASGDSGCRIWERSADGDGIPARARDTYYVVRFIEPLEPNRGALGYDVGSEPARRRALLRAIETGETSISAPIALVQDAEARPAVLAFHPAFRPGTGPDSGRARQRDVLGLVVGVFRVAELVRDATAAFANDPFAIEVYDVTDPATALALHTEPARTTAESRGLPVAPGRRPRASFGLSEGFEVGGRRWRVQLRPTAAALAEYRTWTPTWALAGGLAFTAYVVFTMGALSHRSRRMERLAEERERAREELRAGEARLRVALDSMTEGWFECDLVENHVEVSDRWLHSFGHRREDFDGNPGAWRSLVHPEDCELSMRAATAHARGETPRIECEIRLRTGDGSYRWVLQRGAIVERDEDGRPLRLLGAHTDVTTGKEAEAARERIEAKLQQAQKLESLGVMAGGIAHDFNNLLVGVLGNADLALSSPPGSGDWRESLVQIQLAATRAAELTRQMLAYAGRAKVARTAVDLSVLVREMIHLMEASLPKRVSVRYDFVREPPLIRADATQVRQVVMNLLTNAAEALGEEGGGVSVRIVVRAASREFLDQADLDCTEGPGRFVWLEVRDAGAGMDESVRRRIFDPFFSTKFQGRGLGLAATLGIVTAHGGAIRVDSSPGRGTCIAVLFPIAGAGEARAEPRSTARGEAAGLASGTVLVVDDEPAVRSLARRALAAAGFEVLGAESGERAVELARAHRRDLRAVVLDLTMPGWSGFQTFRELRKCTDAPVVLSTGYPAEECRTEFRGEPPAAVLQKPYRAAELVATVRRVCGEEAR